MSNTLRFVGLLLFLGAFIGGMVYLKPIWDEYTLVQADVTTLQTQKTQLTSQIDSLKDLQEKLSSGSELTQKISLAAIPEKFDQDALIEDLADAARSSNVTLNGVSFSVPTGVDSRQPVLKATMNANLTGTESSLLKFLRAVESNPRKILVKSIAIQVANEDRSDQVTNFNLGLETYFLQ